VSTESLVKAPFEDEKREVVRVNYLVEGLVGPHVGVCPMNGYRLY
jgi:hypothetical protein